MDFKPDWIIHHVQNHDCDVCNTHVKDSVGFYGFADIHTHGLNKHNHPEICIPLDISPKVAMNVLNTIGYRIAVNGEIFKEGYNDTVLAGKYRVKFVKFDDDDTLYLILPDVNNRLPEDDMCDLPYSSQLFYAEIIHNDK